MALFQIAEPGQSAKPHEFRLAVGIDLGTTHSLVATIRNTFAQCIPVEGSDNDKNFLLPSVVYYGKNNEVTACRDENHQVGSCCIFVLYCLYFAW